MSKHTTVEVVLTFRIDAQVPDGMDVDPEAVAEMFRDELATDAFFVTDEDSGEEVEWSPDVWGGYETRIIPES